MHTPLMYARLQVDLDLGNYERFMSLTLSRDHNITTGKVYNEVSKRVHPPHYHQPIHPPRPHPSHTPQHIHTRPLQVIMRERRGDYLGKTVQVVPHVTDEIQVGTGVVAILFVYMYICG